ncbi:hypothetical protein [Mycolicibacterium wolinskyi]|uniref:hypothetical protein n=1 Tax=Mycolicibacterium wolinskyi TaxID=59750 RepID=UPI00391780B0
MTDPSRYPPGWNPPPPGPYHGQPPANPYYGGYQPGYNWPGYGEAPPIHGRPPKRSKTPWIIAAMAAVLVIAIVVGGVLWRFNSGGEDTEAVTTTTSATTSTTATPECEGRVASPTPQTPPDWIAVASPRGLGYDVPPDWTVNSCTAMIGWEVPCPDGPFGFCPVRTMTGSAEMPNKQCPDLHRGATGVPGANSTDDIDEALQRETQLVEDIYTSRSGVVPTVSLGERRELTVSGEPAVQVIATVTGIEASECTGPSALHSMLATKVDGQPGSVMFIVSLEQGYPGAPDPKLIDEIVATLRKDD